MRRLFLLRGAPASGKSTWIKENNLEPYTVSSDDVRLMFSAPVYTPDGSTEISQSEAKEVWDVIKSAISKRMFHGDLTILDATNLKTDDMSVYSKMANEYRYRVYVVDFTDVSRDICLERNRNREELRRVPDYVINSFYNTYANYRLPGGYVHVTKDEALELIYSAVPYNTDSYQALNFFGDIHGCYSVLEQLLLSIGCTEERTSNGVLSSSALKNDELYVFCGDYINRGIENAKVLQFLLEISERTNVMLLEGNHEKWLDDWAHNRSIKNRQFQQFTIPELEHANINKKDVSRLYRRLIPMAFIGIDNATSVFACHGGIPVFPQPFAGISASSLIRGIGTYKDTDENDSTWEFLTGDTQNIYLVHGHRTSKQNEMQPQPHVFSLDGAVERGGELRCVRFEKTAGAVDIKQIKVANNVFEKVSEFIDLETCSVPDAIENLRANPTIREKDLGGGISSFNFSREAFTTGAWDEQNIHARGLFINVNKGEESILARSYDKFFAINERQETAFDIVSHSTTFPIDIYKKENGYLGICSTNNDGKLFFASKSTNKGPFAVTFKKMLSEALGNKLDKFAKMLSAEDATAVFEVIDCECDRHIIKYNQSHVVLLDIIYNDLSFSCMDYEELQDIAKDFKLQVKERVKTIDTLSELSAWYDEVSSKEYMYDGQYVEGFVTIDADYNMYKVKSEYYRYWKAMRGVVHDVMKRGSSSRISDIAVDSSQAMQFYAWLKEYISDWKKQGNLEDPHIIDVRTAWLNSSE